MKKNEIEMMSDENSSSEINVNVNDLMFLNDEESNLS